MWRGILKQTKLHSFCLHCFFLPFLNFIFIGTTGRKWTYLQLPGMFFQASVAPASPWCNDIGKGNKFIYWTWCLMQAWVWSPTVCPESGGRKAKLPTLEWWETRAIRHLQFRSGDTFQDFSWHSLYGKSLERSSQDNSEIWQWETLTFFKHTFPRRVLSTHLFLYTGMWRRQWHPLQYSCLANPMDRGAWWAAVHGVARSRTRLSDFTSAFHFHALEKEMATHSSVLAWRIPGTGEPGGLPFMGSHRVGHN